ncbi:MAG: 30S ribosomal protein S17 [Thaumarchaeota archaeon]|nr:30S ribosomal protein S17 [Nitrososphaerota archaeon]
MSKNIGIPVPPPRRSCDDPNCPFHGNLRVRGKLLKGVVVSTKPEKTVVVEREYYHYVPKYKRYERRRSKIHAHLPPCLDAKEGDEVTIAECRPISKTVAFVVVEVKRNA